MIICTLPEPRLADPPCQTALLLPLLQAAVAEYSAQVQQWAARVQQLEAAGAAPAGAASGSAADAVARLAALQQQASEAEVQVTSLQAENQALREQVGAEGSSGWGVSGNRLWR